MTTGVQVAIKIVDKSGLNVVESNSIKTEAEVMTCLNHPNVVRLLEVIETKYELALIMEYAAGGDLFEYVLNNPKRRKLGETEARKIFGQVVSGLAYCHRHFVVHRDIKAENILLDAQGNVRIGDWGFSSVYHPGLTIETACGSLDYAAPEVLTGLVSYGPSVDIWALGVLLYFLLSSRLPFTAPNDFDIYQLIKKGEYKTPKGISRECKSLLKSLLNPEAQTRITITDVEKHSWMALDLDSPQLGLSSGVHIATKLVYTTPSIPVPSQSTSHSSSHGHHHKDAQHTTSSLSAGTSAPRSRESSSHDLSTHSTTSASSASNSSSAVGSAASSGTSTASSTTVVVKKRKRANKEKRSISDTKLEQSMHQLKAGSGQAPARLARAGARRNATLRSEKSKLKDILGGAAFTASSDPFNTITEGDEEGEDDPDDAAFSGSTSSEDEAGDLDFSKDSLGVSPLVLPISAFASSSSSIPSSPTSDSPLSAHSMTAPNTSSPQSLPKASSTSRLDGSSGSIGNAPVGYLIAGSGSSGTPQGKSPAVSSNSTPRHGEGDLHISGLSGLALERSLGSGSDSLTASQGSLASPSSSTQSPGRSSQPETPGRSKRPKDKKTRSFNTEKTKEELAGVSRFIILKLSTNQLEQLKDMPEFEILQVTKKTTLKEDTLLTVVVATRVPNARKYLKRFEHSRRLFRWNSDTHFGLRSRFRVESGVAAPTPPATPQHPKPSSSFHAATQSPIPFSVSAMTSTAIFTSPLRSSEGAAPSGVSPLSPSALRGRSTSTAGPNSPTQRRAERHERPMLACSPSNSSFTYSHSQPSSASSSSSTENALGSGGHKGNNLETSPRSSEAGLSPPQTSPPTARRRRKSITENRLEGQVGAGGHSPNMRSGLTSSTPHSGTPPSVRPTLRQSNPPAKLARMHSWSQSEFDNAPPGTLKKQLAAGNSASPSALFKFFRKKRLDSLQDSGSDNQDEEGSTENRSSTESHLSFNSSLDNNQSGSSEMPEGMEEAVRPRAKRASHSMKIPTTPIAAQEAQSMAPASSPAKITSPRSRSAKHKKNHLQGSPPTE